VTRRPGRAAVVAAVVLAAVAVVAGLAVVAFRPGTPDGTAAPTAFDLPALAGPGRVRLADYRGTPVVVTLFASWCTACTTELPGFARTAAATRGHVQFIGVDSQETGNGAAFADRFGLRQSGMVLARDIGRSSTGGLYKAYGARGLPVTVIYGADGTIRWKALEAVPEAVLAQELSTVR
jgi:peroxiredoxin